MAADSPCCLHSATRLQDGSSLQLSALPPRAAESDVTVLTVSAPQNCALRPQTVVCCQPECQCAPRAVLRISYRLQDAYGTKLMLRPSFYLPVSVFHCHNPPLYSFAVHLSRSHDRHAVHRPNCIISALPEHAPTHPTAVLESSLRNFVMWWQRENSDTAELHCLVSRHIDSPAHPRSQKLCGNCWTVILGTLCKEFLLKNCATGSVVAALFVILRCWRAIVRVDMWHGRGRACRVWWSRLKE